VSQTHETEDYPQLSTDELVKRLCSGADVVPLPLAQAFVARGSDVVPSLCAIVASPEWWEYEDGTVAIDAMHLLGAIGDPAAASALLAPLFWDEESDWITESMPGILARLGPEAIPLLRSFVEDGSQDMIMRSVVYTGLVGMAVLHPEIRDQVHDIGAQLARRCLQQKEPFPAPIGVDLAEFQDPADVQLLDQLYRSKLWDSPRICKWEDVLAATEEGLNQSNAEHATRDPMQYFSSV